MTTTTLFILNEPPYGNERTYNGLRLAGALAKDEGTKVQIFLMGDAVVAAKKGQKVPQGHYNVDVMPKNVARHAGEIAACSTCMDARGMIDDELEEGCVRGTLEGLAQWTTGADRVLVF
jgi:uncharacterized protein involved in oxidation of intracellular sulfur